MGRDSMETQVEQMRERSPSPSGAVVWAAGALACAALCACDAPPRAWAGKIAAPSQLVGGPRTLGEVGDYRISNNRVRFVVQGLDLAKGIAGDRAFGAFGGALLDADLARAEEARDPRTQANGRDGLGEIFPTFFLQGLEPDAIEVVDDGSTGKPAWIRVTGKGSDFFTATKLVNAGALGSGLQYELDYRLGPDDDALWMTASIINPSASSHFFPIDQFPIPIGFIPLFGDGQPLFMPGEAGFDVRFTLQKAYGRPYKLPALGGVTSDVIAVSAEDITYGMSYCSNAICPPPADLNAIPGAPSFAFNHQSEYGKYSPITEQTMLLPFVSGSLFGLYLEEVPAKLPGAAAVSATMKLRVSGLSPSSVINAAMAEAGIETGTVTGIVRERQTGRVLPLADVIFLQEDGVHGASGLAINAARTDEFGRFTANLPPGGYVAVTRLGRREHAPNLAFSVRARKHVDLEAVAQATGVDWTIPRDAILKVRVADETGRLIPAKVTIDAAYEARLDGSGNVLPAPDPKTFLYDLRLGDPYRPTDMTPDTQDPETRRYIEETFRAVNGLAEGEVRPGKWRITVSRGPAYSLSTQEVTLVAGEVTTVGATLQRLLPARGRVTSDQHAHTTGSVDSNEPPELRVISYAAEGIDWVVATDHNALTDLAPAIERTGLLDFLKTSVGIELSSLEAGHNNGYPLEWLPTPATHGSMPWFNRIPQQLYDGLRARRGAPLDSFVVQANHPRDSVQGVFTAYGMTGDPLAFTDNPDGTRTILASNWPGAAGTFAPSGPGFGPNKLSLDFDAMEVFNAKRLDITRTFRVPPASQLSSNACDYPPRCGTVLACDGKKVADKPCMGPTGTIVRDANDLVAFPGAFEDWEHLLDAGKRATAVGNSDSHELFDEAGYPRNLVDVGHDVANAREIDPNEVARAIKAGRSVVTNGPEIRLTVLDPVKKGADGKPLEIPMGGLVRPDSAGTVQVHLIVEAAPWIDVSYAALLVGSPDCLNDNPKTSLTDCHEKPVPIDRGTPGSRKVGRLDTILKVSVPKDYDSWVAAFVRGETSLWPVLTPLEVPPLLLNDAISALTSAFGLSDPLKKLRPVTVTQALPNAIANPVLVDGDGDGKWFGKDVPEWKPSAK
jgi:hypothetical protein